MCVSHSCVCTCVSTVGFSMDGVYEEAPPDVYDPAVDGAGTSPWGVLAVPLTSPGSDEVCTTHTCTHMHTHAHTHTHTQRDSKSYLGPSD